jgi:acetyl-CoA acetyltransferase
MPDAVIVSAVRTAIGTARKGTLSETEASVLAQPVVEEALARTGLAPTDIDDLILAESLYGGGVVARYVAVVAGMDSVPGLAHNRHCASGLAAVQTASASIMAGMDKAVIAGGVQASSLSPRDKRRVAGTDDWEDWMSLSHPSTAEAPALDMSITVGWNTAQRVGASREDLDA